MLDLAVRVIETGEQGPSEGDLVHFDEVLDELRGRDGRVELLAGYATIAAYRISVDDQEYELDQAPDPYYYDAEDPARDAAYAASSGAPFNKPSDPARRREFWTWWLREAVPTAAFSAVPYR